MGRAVASTQRSNQSHHLAWIGFAHAFRLTKSHARKSEFAEAIQRDLGRPVPWPKIFRLCRRANQLHWFPRPASIRGAFRDRHERWCGMRWTPWWRADERHRGGRQSRVVL